MSILGNMVKNTAKGFVISSATAVAVSGISHMLGLSDSKIARVLSVGVPMMAWVASDDPSITDLLFKESKKKDSRKNKDRKEAEDDFFNIFGDKGHTMNKLIAEEADATEEEVNGIMSLFMPTFLDGIAAEEPKDSGSLNKMFKKETEAAKKQSPSLGRMMMKAVF